MNSKATIAEAPPTDLEIDIARFEGQVEKMKHIDGRNFALTYCFPLLRRLAAMVGDQEEDIQDIGETVSAMASEADEIVETLERAREYIAKLASRYDDVMVAAGFCVVTKRGLALTDKCPPAQRADYEASGPEGVEIVTEIQHALDEAEQRASAAEEEDDADGADGGAVDVEGAADLDAPDAKVAGDIAAAALTAAVADEEKGGANGAA